MEHLTIDRAHDGFIRNEFTCRDLVTYYLERIRLLNGPLPVFSHDEIDDEIDDNHHGDDKASVLPIDEPTTIPPLPSSSSPPTSDKANQDVFYLNAIISVSETALEEADELDDYWFRSNRWKGVLHGIPVIVKDSIATAGLRTTFGSSRAAHYIPTQDATVIQNLKKEGAIILAKSTLPDWSASLFCTSSLSGTTGNPFDLRRDPCSGTAAAIAADFAILGLDTDTDGTIGLSASFCSLVGVRPRPGMISRHGISPLVAPQDTPGPICRTVRDAALMYGAMVGFDPQDILTAYSTIVPKNLRRPAESFAMGLDSSALDASSLRIGVVNSLFGDDDTDPDHYAVNQPIRIALNTLEEAGATLVPITIPHLQQWLTTTQLHIYRSQSDLNRFFTSPFAKFSLGPRGGCSGLGDLTVRSLAEEYAHHPTQDLFERIAQGANPPDRHLPYHICLEKHDEFRPLVMSKMRERDVDFLAFPTSQVPAPLIVDVLNKKWNFQNFPSNAHLAAQTLLPSISVPIGHTEPTAGRTDLQTHQEELYLPIGLTLVTSIYHEKDLLGAAAAVEYAVNGSITPDF